MKLQIIDGQLTFASIWKLFFVGMACIYVPFAALIVAAFVIYVVASLATTGGVVVNGAVQHDAMSIVGFVFFAVLFPIGFLLVCAWNAMIFALGVMFYKWKGKLEIVNS